MTRKKLECLNRFQYSTRYLDEIDSESKISEDFLKREIQSFIDELKKYCDKLETLAIKQYSEGSRRANTKYKVDQLKTDIRCVKFSYASLQARAKQKEQEANNRKSLLNMSFTTNAEEATKNSVNAKNTTADSTSILIDRAMAQNESLKFSNRAVDDMLNQGSQMLGKICLLLVITFSQGRKLAYVSPHIIKYFMFQRTYVISEI